MPVRTLKKIEFWKILFIVGLVLGINGLLLIAVAEPVVHPAAGNDAKTMVLIAGAILFVVGLVVLVYWRMMVKSLPDSKKLAFITLLFFLLMALPAIVYSA